MAQAASSSRKHPYHMVEPSPWPAVGALTAFLLTFGGVMAMQGKTLLVVLLGAVMMAVTMYGWWSDVVKEATVQKMHTPVVRLGLRYGMALFIASEVMFFSAFFWAFFGSALYPNEVMGGVWPPKGVTVFKPFGLPFLNTVILLTSGVTVTWAHHALRAGNRQQTVLGLIVTVALGLTFTAVQAYEYSHAPFTFGGGIYPSVFFMATGFHGLHVIIGSIFLIVCTFRAAKGHFKPEHHFGFEAAAWYWHFVDVVWLFLFFCIYWWGKGNAPVV